jgi:hypothetical protein
MNFVGFFALALIIIQMRYSVESHVLTSTSALRGIMLSGMSELEGSDLGDEGWVCKIDAETGTCGEVDMSNLAPSMLSMAQRLFGVKQGRCNKYGYCRFVRREDADCGPLLGMRESRIYERRRGKPNWLALSAQLQQQNVMQRQQVFRTLISRSLQRIISAADVHPGRTIVL